MSIKIELIEKPARKAVIKRGINAEDYFAYCGEVGCDIWDILIGFEFRLGEPVCLWLCPPYQKPGTSRYVQGVETAADYDGPVPEGFDVIDLPPSSYLMFRGEPFEEENFCEAITEVQKFMANFEPASISLCWDYENPRIQLEPLCERGYIELKAVKKL